MHLQRIQVPDFRVLKDVDITFEKEFVPRIFPVGSLNGGGKSTLLQLIFVLLHCSTNPDRIVFLKNMLNGFRVYENADKRTIAIVEVWDGDKSVKLDFFSYKDSYIRNLLDQDGDSEVSDEVDDYEYLKFSVLEETKKIKDKASAREKTVYEIIDSFQKLIKFQDIRDDKKRKSLATEEVLRLRIYGVEVSTTIDSPFEKIQAAIQEELIAANIRFTELQSKYKELEFYSQKVHAYLQSEKLTYICNYSLNENEDENEVLLCHIDNVEINEAESFLEGLSQKVFLAAPATQVFLFLSKYSRKLLFRDLRDYESKGGNSYYSELQSAKSELPVFFAYDFLAVDLLVESFKAARYRDFKEAL
jgi:energy-coupling factor transporter ATP-binding protein EcfA2